MEQEYQIEIDALATALTKPVTQFGVPMVPFYFNCMACFLVWIVLQNLVNNKIAVTLFMILIFFIIHSAMLIVTLNDPFGLRIYWFKLTEFKRHITFNFWNNTDSYSA